MASAEHAAATNVRQVGQNVRFFNEAVNQALDANNTGVNPNSPITYPANGTPFQDWILMPSPGGYLIRSVSRNLCLQAPSGPGQPILLSPCNPFIPTEQWRIDPIGDKFTISEAVDENLVIQATGSQSPVVNAFRDGNPLQRWDITSS
ncbi:RICIN domain-containing protein [Kitasatospora sp. HPMI-4]|uniref:RICIN domain-containing protein n=1 Tax=Kitasatospora sp. HPMI-4 TaxID=3448443 RepID=UPI003F1E3B0A